MEEFAVTAILVIVAAIVAIAAVILERNYFQNTSLKHPIFAPTFRFLHHYQVC